MGQSYQTKYASSRSPVFEQDHGRQDPGKKTPVPPKIHPQKDKATI